MTRILVIEDDVQIRDIVLEILELEGFETLSATNGISGLALAREHVPDLIVSDLMMPDLDGYGVLKALRQDPATDAIPMILLTAKSDRTSFRTGMKMGADDYLTKPFTHGEILEAINTQLQKKSRTIARYSNRIDQLQADLDFANCHDSVTQLPNWKLLQQRFNQIQAQADYQQQLAPLLLIGLDQFDWIRSNSGQAFSETLLKTIAQQLATLATGIDGQRSVVEHHPIFIARLEADQFAVLPGIFNQQQEILQLVQTFLQGLSQPIVVKDQDVFITASIGIALYPEDDTDIDLLVSNARVAMHYAKQQGGNCYQFYADNISVKPGEQLAIATCLPQALERGEFQVYYQPQVDLRTGQIIGAEALVRWHHPEWGVVSPGKFIAVAEETGLIVPLGEWVLRSACQQVKHWQDQCSTVLKISVNLSARQFDQPNLSRKIQDVISEFDLVPELLELELTESTLMRDTKAAIKTMQELKAIGVNLSIDDFGVGYSSLSYLQQLTFDTLKIDRCFVRHIDTNPANAAITSAVISMARDLNLKVVGEGVETIAERDFLLQQQCDAFQGYLVSPPVPADKFFTLACSQPLEKPQQGSVNTMGYCAPVICA